MRAYVPAAVWLLMLSLNLFAFMKSFVFSRHSVLCWCFIFILCVSVSLHLSVNPPALHQTFKQLTGEVNIHCASLWLLDLPVQVCSEACSFCYSSVFSCCEITELHLLYMCIYIFLFIYIFFTKNKLEAVYLSSAFFPQRCLG